MLDTREGSNPVPGGNVWYRVIGGSEVSLVTLHGGPSTSSDYLKPMTALASEQRGVVLYDQLGGGRSDRPDDKSLWRIERFVEEIDALRDSLGLERIHLLGHSWGGWLAIEYMLSQPKGVVSLILASTTASVPEYNREVGRLKSELPTETWKTFQRYEASGELDNPEYQAAELVWYQTYLCRLDPWPEDFTNSMKGIYRNQCYVEMEGLYQIECTGNMRDWDRIDRLGEITAPTLITVGRYDGCTPVSAATMNNGIPYSKMIIFESSSHVPHYEEPQGYMRVLREFLDRVEAE